MAGEIGRCRSEMQAQADQALRRRDAEMQQKDEVAQQMPSSVSKTWSPR